MTTVDTETPSESRGLGERLRDATLARVVMRWCVMIGLTVFAYWSTLESIGIEMRSGTLITYTPAAIALTLMACIGIGLRQGNELPIYDRQSDIIVGTVVLILALFMESMLVPRYQSTYLPIHIDLLSMWLFLLGTAIILFGLRPVGRYRWAWFLLLSIFPLPYRMLVITFGSNRVAASIVMLLLAIAAAAVAVGRTPRRAAAGGALAAAVGIALIVVLAIFAPTAPIWVYQTVPPIGCVFVTGLVMYVDHRRGWGSLRPLDRDLNPLPAPDVLRGTLFAALVAVLITLIPVPDIRPSAGVTVPGLNMRPPLTIPDDWRQTGVKPYGVSSLYGPGAVDFLGIGHVAGGELVADRLFSPDEVARTAARRAGRAHPASTVSFAPQP